MGIKRSTLYYRSKDKMNKKNELSHRRIALDKFVKWFNQNNKLNIL